MGGGGGGNSGGRCGGRCLTFSCGGPEPNKVISSAPAPVIMHLVEAATSTIDKPQDVAIHDSVDHIGTINSSLQSTCKAEFHKEFGYSYDGEHTKPPKAGLDAYVLVSEDFVNCDSVDTSAVKTYIKGLLDNDTKIPAAIKEAVVTGLIDFVVPLLNCNNNSFALKKYEQSFASNDQEEKTIHVQLIAKYGTFHIPTHGEGDVNQFFMYFVGVSH